MADNTYTAFDPIFLSYHANMDRLAGLFIDAHPDTQLTSSFPLQPFMDNGTSVRYDDPRRWAYTTIGDMAKDTRALGYMYGPPLYSDAHTPLPLEKVVRVGRKAASGRAISLPAGVNGVTGAGTNGNTDAKSYSVPGVKTDKVPHVVFEVVGCTASSFIIDVFVGEARDPEETSPGLHNPDFIGRITRLGMGLGREGTGLRNGGRCRRPGTSRLLVADKVAKRLAAGEQVKVVVTDLETGRRMDAQEYQKMPGFEPKLLWLPTAG